MINPLHLAEQIEQRYQRYLKTTFYFKDPELRKSFEESLESGYLSKGPYLEATPIFKRGQTAEALFRNLLGFQLDEGFMKAIMKEPLYLHQETSIQRAYSGHNVVVATGTGSGKTEAFLYPILLHLYQEYLDGTLRSGTRAMILYPMNALANDQRDRLGNICKKLKEADSQFRFTFGQYIGETPDDENDTNRNARDHLAFREQKGYSVVENGEVVHGEMVLRSEMRRTPPHILLTNYSMLEYLLLRPLDSQIFDNGRARRWKFIVLDEAHQYRGSQGIEMALLLRRLKQRLREGGRIEPFSCIATSATLVGGAKDKAAVAKFATDLFDANFCEDDVILGGMDSIPKLGPKKLLLEDYCYLREILENKDEKLKHIAGKLQVSLQENSSVCDVVQLLQKDARCTHLRHLITGKPTKIQEVADQVFDDLTEQRVEALAILIDLLLKVKNPSTDAPLLSARYHLFLRSLRGAFISYWPEKKIFLDRQTEPTTFEVAICRECGQHYIIAPRNFVGGKIAEVIRDPNDVNFGATFLRPIENDVEVEDDNDLFYICIQCGEAWKQKSTCSHNNYIRVAKEKPPSDEDRADQLAECGACGYNAAGRDPVREVVHGTDGPHAVIATALYKELPKDRNKVLAFADSRQEAAFFAWYLDDSYRYLLNRNLIYKAAQRLYPYAQEGISLREIATELRKLFSEKKVLPQARGDLESRRDVWLSLYREFLTDEPRISLEGVGLVFWTIKWSKWFMVPQFLKTPPWSLTDQQARNLIFILVDTMRFDGAVELQSEKGVTLNWNDLNLQGSQVRYQISNPRGVKYLRGWDNRQAKRAQFLAKLLLRLREGLSKEAALDIAVDTLSRIWEYLCQSDEKASTSLDRLLFSVGDGRRINPDWYRLHLIHKDDVIYKCNTCERLQAISVHNLCLRYRCSGTLEPVKVCDLEPNHYYQLYEETLPGIMRVEEHTAQLDKEKAREFQRDFKEGKINVLSCSTTFELGVDLGDLDNIFLRNVPPEAFNYAQRVGRCGRRSGHPGFAVTYCRHAPHDIYHFTEPEHMLSGLVRPPVLSLQNEKIITRHITAVALSQFFREQRERFKSVERLFGNLKQPSGASEFKDFLIRLQVQIEESIRAIVPLDMFEEVGLSNGGWIEKSAGENSRFALAESEVSSDYQVVKNLEKETSSQGDYRTAQWALTRANTISNEDVLSFLSRKAVIPKYGFPVDVVELDTQRLKQNHEASKVLLQRDLRIAISEFAPTSELVANKKLWTSYGLKKVVGKEWKRKYYKKCPKHNVFLCWDEGQDEPPTPCSDTLTRFQYIVPNFGFITDRSKPKEPKSRKARAFSTRPYFACSLGPEPGNFDLPTAQTPLITVRKASPGLMVVLCEGQRGEGFYICKECGAGFKSVPRGHNTPYGQKCMGIPGSVSLGHEFVTDVLQIQFHPKPQDNMNLIGFTYSLSYALIEGAAKVLEVPPNDLSATVAYSQQHSVLPIIMYDDVPGGAGLVARLEDVEILKDCLIAAQKRVSGNCGCGKDTSCYGCLRSYRNQFAHKYLQRGPVLNYLESLLKSWESYATMFGRYGKTS